jgi:UDP-N-acetylmuramoyl-L-alanyl-D-glutamate--2,6-diaminopimelate ligase
MAAEALADTDVALVVAEDPRAAMACAAALWFGAQPETVVAVTGTNGKTSVATFTRQIWAALGHEAINIGTTGIEGAWSAPSSHTTPDAITLQKLLAAAAQGGVTHAAMEASSHGIDQRRLDGVRLKAAGFTNLTQDHLDYHGTMAAYFEAKAQLFTRLLPEDGVAVVNLDGAKGSEMAELALGRGLQVLTVGKGQGADLQIASTRPDATGQEVRYLWQGRAFQTRLALIGAFQAENVAVAAGLVIAAGEASEAVLAVLPRLTGVRGRMQLAATRRNGAAVYVDYAHTPDAIETALKALRPHVMGRIVIVFGAGGDRDRTKRPLMGAAARAHADVLYVTDDNPRSEDPASIRAAILAACPEANEVGDRAEAILRAVDALLPGDALLIAGKGHESGQIVGTDIYPFDDVEQASVAVAALDGVI